MFLRRVYKAERLPLEHGTLLKENLKENLIENPGKPQILTRQLKREIKRDLTSIKHDSEHPTL